MQTAADALKDAVIACKAEITGVCGKILPGQGRIAACLLSNKSTASAGCVDAIQKIESMATHEAQLRQRSCNFAREKGTMKYSKLKVAIVPVLFAVLLS